MNSQALDVRNGGQCGGQLGQFGGRQRQRIAAGKNDLSDRSIRAKLGNGILPSIRRCGFLAIRKMTAKTVAAVHCARTRRDQQCAAAVFAQQAAPGACIEIADRKSTRLNSSHPSISYAVFCLKKKKKQTKE